MFEMLSLTFKKSINLSYNKYYSQTEVLAFRTNNG